MTGSDSPPPVRRVVETALYVADLPRSERFYGTVLGLERMWGDGRLVALDAGGGTVLLLFHAGASSGSAETDIPPHDAEGRIHFALAVDADDLDDWRTHLDRLGVAVESEQSWPRGGTSLYLRDPDDHLVELATPGIWPSY